MGKYYILDPVDRTWTRVSKVDTSKLIHQVVAPNTYRVQRWLMDNCTNAVVKLIVDDAERNKCEYYFKDAESAMLFKLTWYNESENYDVKAELPYYVTMRSNELPTSLAWCEDNLEEADWDCSFVRRSGPVFLFRNEEDALIFKLACS
jgi:hypothetical protein